jgi:hypothetical protein
MVAIADQGDRIKTDVGCGVLDGLRINRKGVILDLYVQPAARNMKVIPPTS